MGGVPCIEHVWPLFDSEITLPNRRAGGWGGAAGPMFDRSCRATRAACRLREVNLVIALRIASIAALAFRRQQITKSSA